MALTHFHIDKAVPREGRFELADGHGLSLRIMPTGAKTWIYRYQFDGKPRRMTLGAYPAFTLSEAREAHTKAVQDVKKGIDPGLKKQQEKQSRKAAPTIKEFIEEFWDKELTKMKSGPETLRLLKKDVVSAWGNRKVMDIKRRDIVLLLDKVRERAPIGANRVLGALTRMFNFAAERGIIEDSPCLRIKKSKEKSRSRVLTDEEIRLLWAALDLDNREVDMFHVTKLALKMILLTGQRPGEVAGMAWDELKLKETGREVWNIPAERMKGKEPHSLPLCSMAIDIIEKARAYSSQSEYVFISPQAKTYLRKKPSKAQDPQERDMPLSSHALARAIARHWQEMKFDERFAPHDLRRTVRTRMASEELGISDIVAEKVLGHKLQGILAVYNRYDYAAEKRAALDKWERELMRILGMDSHHKDNIITFPGVRRGNFI